MGITERVYRANRGLDGLLIAVSPLALKVGLIVGTVSLLMGGIFAQNTAFMWVWSIIQAIGVDSVFLITSRIALKSSKWSDRIGFGLLSVLYGAVGFLALNVVSYQELRASSLASAMSVLGIDLGVFTTLRSVVIIVTIALFYLVESKAEQVLGLGVDATQAQPVKIVEATQEHTKITQAQPLQIERPGNNEYQIAHRVTLQPTPLQPVPLGLTQEDEGVTQEVNPSQPLATQEDEGLTLADNPTYQRVMGAYQRLTQDGEKVTAEKVVEISGVGLSSAKKYLRVIREQ